MEDGKLAFSALSSLAVAILNAARLHVEAPSVRRDDDFHTRDKTGCGSRSPTSPKTLSPLISVWNSSRINFCLITLSQ